MEQYFVIELRNLLISIQLYGSLLNVTNLIIDSFIINISLIINTRTVKSIISS